MIIIRQTKPDFPWEMKVSKDSLFTLQRYRCSLTEIAEVVDSNYPGKWYMMDGSVHAGITMVSTPTVSTTLAVPIIAIVLDTFEEEREALVALELVLFGVDFTHIYEA